EKGNRRDGRTWWGHGSTLRRRSTSRIADCGFHDAVGRGEDDPYPGYLLHRTTRSAARRATGPAASRPPARLRLYHGGCPKTGKPVSNGLGPENGPRPPLHQT